MSYYEEADIARRAAEVTGPVDQLAERILALMKGPDGERRSDEARRLLEHDAIQHHLAVEFGRRHGWTLARRDFTLDCLARRGLHGGYHRWFTGNADALDHPIFYRLNRRAAAIAVHLYNGSGEKRQAELVTWAAGHRLKATFPDFPSWWFPGYTTLVLYEPTDEPTA